jgi:hypothetical protein
MLWPLIETFIKTGFHYFKSTNSRAVLPSIVRIHFMLQAGEGMQNS